MAVPRSDLALGDRDPDLRLFGVRGRLSATPARPSATRRLRSALLVATLVAGAAIVLPMGLVARFPAFLGLGAFSSAWPRAGR